MRICAFSDMHGNLDFKVEPCDVVMICGDIVPLYIQRHLVDSEVWFRDVFIPWCNELPCERVVLVAGNHDFAFETVPGKMKDHLKDQDKIVYLDCETYEYDGYVIFGTPMCKIFGNWAFMYTQEEQKDKYDRYLSALDKVDILMTHDAPYGTSDILLQEDCPWADGEHIGNKALADFVSELKPRLYIHGHLHSTNHELEKIGDTSVYNVSLLDENYKMTYKPLYINL